MHEPLTEEERGAVAEALRFLMATAVMAESARTLLARALKKLDPNAR